MKQPASSSRGPRGKRPSAMALGVGGLVIAALVVAGLFAVGSLQLGGEPQTDGGAATTRRLNESQYKQSIADVFGKDISVPGRFEPPLRESGLLAIGEGKVAVSPSGFEQYELRARDIAAQVLSPDRRADFVSCAPEIGSVDTACVKDFFARYGAALYRRPLSAGELDSTLQLTRLAAQQTGDLYKGLEIGLSRLLASPNFIFRSEVSEPVAAAAGEARLDQYSLASRLSFLLWNAPPDDELMQAAANGNLYNRRELGRQVDRMIASPRFADGVRAYFSDMLGYDQFLGLTKDQVTLPLFTSQLAEDAREQTLRTIVDHLVTRDGDYRDLFTTRNTFINRRLGALYRVVVPPDAVEGWAPYTLPADMPRAGILTLAGFLMLDQTHEGRSSPTIRGKMVRELFLCQTVPPPPPNVDFSVVQDTGNAVHRTARERLTVHQSVPTCAGCHKLTDTIGIGLENFNAIGEFRARENGAVIDASGVFDGMDFADAVELGKRLRDNPGTASCVVRRSFEYGVGRPATRSETRWLRYVADRFAADGYSFKALMRRIAMSEAFSAVSTESEVAVVSRN